MRTRAALDYETKTTYSMTATVSDGNGGSDSMSVTITVTDVDEKPATPAAPTVSATSGSTTSLDVSWTAPDRNGGPAIAGYDLRYRQGTSGNFTNGPQNVTGTSTTITGLTANTAYQVQVRALNGETPSDWSASGTGSTGSPTNNAPAFTDGNATARSVAENTATGTDIGAAVAATDADSGDTLTYSLGGTDASSFDIVSTSGQLRTRAALDRETRSSYAVTVSVSDGNGGSDSINVTITVTDVDEAPAAPTNLAASAGDARVTLTWTAPAHDGGSPITGYQYQRKTTGNYGNAWTDIPGSGPGTTSHTVTGLTNGTPYTFRLRARNSVGAGPASGDASGTPSETGNAGITLVDEGGQPLALPPRLTVPEGGSAIFGFKLNTRPTHSVWVGFSHGGGDEHLLSLSSTVWAISPDEWETPYWVTVEARDDDDAVNGERTFETFANSDDPDYSVVNNGDPENEVENAPTGRLRMPDLVAVEADSAAQPGTVQAGEPVTARFESLPAAHDGEHAFTFELRFSEEIAIGYRNVRDDVLAVTGGRVTGARRLARPSNRRWEITLAPESGAEVTIALPPGRACGETGAVCTADGRALAAGVAAIVPGPAAESSPQTAATPLTARFLSVPAEHDGETRVHLRASVQRGDRDRLQDGARRGAGGNRGHGDGCAAPGAAGQPALGDRGGAGRSGRCGCAAGADRGLRGGGRGVHGGRQEAHERARPHRSRPPGPVGGRRRGDGGTGREPRLRGDALAGGIGDGDGGLRDGERHGDGGRGLHREERNADLRAGRDGEDHRGAGARRRA